MPRTEAEQIAWELQCYGMTEAEVLAEKPEFTDPLMYAMSILSDVQHLMKSRTRPPSENAETARQWINKAKFWMGLTRREIASANSALRLVS